MTITFVSQWLSQTTPAELNRMAGNGDSLAILLRPYGWMVKMAKMRNSDFYMTADELLEWMFEHFPQHATVAFTHRKWFTHNVDELIRFIEAA